jgi:hypothetical protein
VSENHSPFIPTFDHLSFLRPISWQEVFEDWRTREASNPRWVECATKVKGWPDWESWRLHTSSQLHLPDRSWGLYEVIDPATFLPNLLLGPFHAWQKYTQEKNALSFADLFCLEEPREIFSKHPAVEALRKDFPASTELIGLVREDNQKIVCVEGHHRAAAVALGQVLGQPVRLFGSVRMALAHLPLNEIHLLNETSAQGSVKPSACAG